ncbi:HEAT repeat domain-containing protein [Mongoliibacter ruber]|uniref:HEAT repeat protein n=1 Tax=Mongoliibacter ruber TaxID=1750599 RepID=A0A2T0WWA3_9BACT|nr:hypothetical protein [Mongoliibacter ruber]PRY90983.1 hypothetical protein CLW00_101659 [Mongoliibacter ruber]
MTFFALLLFFSLQAQQPEPEEDFVPVPVEEVLSKGLEIPGVRFVYSVSLPSNIDASGYALNPPSSANLWATDTLQFFIDAKALQDSIYKHHNVLGEIQSFLFDETISEEGLQAYFDNLLRNELYIIEEAQVSEDVNVGELIILGNKIPFKPFYRLKIQILTDIRMIILISFLTFFVLAAIVLVIVIFIIKTNKRNKDILVMRFKDLCYEPLSNLLFEKSLEDIQNMSKGDIAGILPKNLMHKPLFKDVLIQEIISLNKNMKGDFKLKLKLVYRKLDLDKHTIKKLSSKRWDIITTGIVEINEMDVVEAEAKVAQFINHENFYIRSNAVATLLNISSDSDLKVLADQKYPLSKWQQMIYYRIIRYTKNNRNVSFLLESENESVRVFGVKLIRYLGLVDQLEFLNNYYPQAGDPEKIEILRCFNMFGFVESLDVIYADLKSENKDLVKEAVSLIQNIGDKISLVALFELSQVTEDFDIKKAAMKAIYTLNKIVFEEYFGESADDWERKICLHLNDPVLTNV